MICPKCRSLSNIDDKKCEVCKYPILVNNEEDIPQHWFKKGFVLYSQKQYSQSIVNFKLAIEADPDYDEAWNALGASYLKLKEFSKALESFDHALLINPLNEKAISNKAILISTYSKYPSKTDIFNFIVNPSRKISRMERVRDIHGLNELLFSNDSNTTNLVILSMSRLKDPAFILPLSKIYPKSDETTKKLIRNTLMEIQGPETINYYIKVLAGQDPDLQMIALNSLRPFIKEYDIIINTFKELLPILDTSIKCQIIEYFKELPNNNIREFLLSIVENDYDLIIKKLALYACFNLNEGNENEFFDKVYNEEIILQEKINSISSIDSNEKVKTIISYLIDEESSERKIILNFFTLKNGKMVPKLSSQQLANRLKDSISSNYKSKMIFDNVFFNLDKESKMKLLTLFRTFPCRACARETSASELQECEICLKQLPDQFKGPRLYCEKCYFEHMRTHQSDDSDLKITYLPGQGVIRYQVKK